MQISGVPQVFAEEVRRISPPDATDAAAIASAVAATAPAATAAKAPAVAASAPAKPKPPSPEAKRFEAEANKISKDLSRLVFEVRTPGTLSTGPAKPMAELARRLDPLETQVLQIKRKLEGYLANPKSTGMEDISGARVIRFYFEQAMKIIQVRALTGERVDPDKYDFQIPYRLLEEMSGLKDMASSNLLTSALADPNGLIALDRGSLRGSEPTPNHPVRLQIGKRFAERLILIAKAGLSDERAFVLALKSVAVSGLLDQWEHIERIRKSPVNDMPAIPSALAQEMGLLGQPEVNRAQRDLMQAEPERRAAFVKGFGQWSFKLDGTLKPEGKNAKVDPTTPAIQAQIAKLVAAVRASGLEFSDASFLDGFIAAAIGEIPVSEENAKKKAALVTALQTAETLNIQIGLTAAISDFPLPLVEMSHVDLKRALRKILAQAKFIAILPVLKTIKTPENRDAEVAAFFDASTNAYIKRLETSREADRTIEGWISASAVSKGDAQQKAHREFVEDALRQSLLLARDRKAPLNPADEVSFEALARVGRMTAEYRALPESAREDLEMILKIQDWNKSVQAYRYLLSALAASEKRARESKNETNARSAAEEARVLRAVGPQFALREAGPIAEKLTLSEVSTPLREAVVLWSDQLRLNNSLLTVDLAHPVVAAWRPATEEYVQEVVKDPLYQVVAEQVRALPQGAQSAEAFSVAEELTERGFEVLRSNIRSQLTLLSSISGQDPKKQIERLLPFIVRSTLLKAELTKAFPALAEQLEAATEAYTADLRKRKLVVGGQEALMKPMGIVMLLFTSRMLLMLAGRGTRPFARALGALEMGFSSQMQGLMVAAIPLMFVDLHLDSIAADQSKIESEETQTWFRTSAKTTSFFDHLSVEDAASKADAAKTKYYTTAAMLGLFAALPIGVLYGRGDFYRVFDGWKIDTFKRLGFSSPEIEAIAASSEGRPLPEGVVPFTFNINVIRARAQERGLVAEGEQLVAFIEKQKNTAQRMLRDFDAEFRALGIPKGQETLNQAKLLEALRRLPERDRKKGQEAYDEITRSIMSVWGGSVSPIRQLYYRVKKIEPRMGPKEAFRMRLYNEVYGFADEGAPSFWFRKDGSVRDLYAELGLGFHDVRTMTPELAERAIKQGYSHNAMRYHPDRNREPGAEAIFKEKKEAYEVLSDFVQKANYDLLWMRVYGATGGRR